jgi:hypothetical protein
MTWPITISILALVVSALSLYFSVFKDYIDVPRIAVTFDRTKDSREQHFTQVR